MLVDNADLRRKQELAKEAGLDDLLAAYASCFIDDQTWLAIRPVARPMTAIAAALWKKLKLDQARPAGQKSVV